MKVINQYKLGNKKSKVVEKATLEPKPRATKKRAARKPPIEEVKIEATSVASPLEVEEPVIIANDEISDDIKEILANSEV